MPEGSMGRGKREPDRASTKGEGTHRNKKKPGGRRGDSGPGTPFSRWGWERLRKEGSNNRPSRAREESGRHFKTKGETPNLENDGQKGGESLVFVTERALRLSGRAEGNRISPRRRGTIKTRFS